MTFRHGLIIGKFYPPHAGHHFLIRTAAANCEWVTVVVEHTRYQRIPIEQRVQWLREEHQADTNVSFRFTANELPVNLTDDATWHAEVAIVTQALDGSRGGPIDAVFSSEFYGERLATYFPGAVHVMVDQPRQRVPMSATRFRNNPLRDWHNLSPATRAGLTTRVCVVGSESTGTTTLARMLTDHYRRRSGLEGTQCVPEYGRTYCDEIVANRGQIEDYVWRGADFDHIGVQQNVWETSAARTGSPLLVCDTDALATYVWGFRYLRETEHEIGSALWSRPPLCPPKDVYLITDSHEVPFEQDGTRDGEHIRDRMTQWFIQVLADRRQPWVLLTGSLQDRFRLALAVSDTLLHENLGRLR